MKEKEEGRGHEGWIKGQSIRTSLLLPPPSFRFHPSSFQTPCQKRGFGVKSPSVFETMATGAFSRERSLRLVGGRVFPKTRRKNNLWHAKRLYSI